MIGRNNIINYLTTGEKVSVGDNIRIIGNDKATVVLEKGVTVNDAATIMAGVTIKENKTVNYGESLTKEGVKNG